MTIPQPTAATTIAITTGDVGNSSMCTASSPARPDRFRAKIRCDNNAPRPPRARKSAADPARPPSRSLAEELHAPDDVAGSPPGVVNRQHRGGEKHHHGSHRHANNVLPK